MTIPFDAPPGTHLTIVRHGETLWNREKRWQGSQDIPLSDLGREQGTALAKRLRDTRFDHIYASDLSRAAETAELIVAQNHAVPIQYRAALQEVKMGPFEGLVVDEVMARYATEFQRRVQSDDPADFDFALPGMESRNTFNARASQAVQACAAAHPGERVLVVCHGGVIRSFFAAALGLAWSVGRQVDIPNCAYNALRADRGRWRLITWGDVGHLGELVTRAA